MKPKTVTRYLLRDGFHVDGALPVRFWQGLTGSELFFVRTKEHGDCVFKHNYNRAWVRREGMQTTRLHHRRPTPLYRRIYWAAPTHVIAEFVPNASDLSQILHAGVGRTQRAKVLRAVDTVLHEMSELWTSHPITGRGVESLYRRAVLGRKAVYPCGHAGQYVKRLLREKHAFHLPIVVNGQDVGMTPSQMLQVIHDVLSERRLEGCLLHGDLRPDNILMTKEGDVRLIDPRVGETDPARDLALFARTENVLTAQDLHAAELRVSHKRLELCYESTFDPLCATIAEKINRFGIAFAEATHDPSWYIRSQMHLGSVCIADIRFYERRKGPAQKIPHLVTYLLGEAALAVARAQQEKV